MKTWKLGNNVLVNNIIKEWKKNIGDLKQKHDGDGDGNEGEAKQNIYRAEQQLSTCVLKLCIFLGCPLQKDQSEMTKHLRGLMTETLRGNFLSFFKKLKAAPTTYAGEKKSSY